MTIPYGKQSISEDDATAVAEALKSDAITTGPLVDRFEREFADIVGSKYAVCVSSGTAALHIAALASRLSEGDELITSAMTFVADANCALYCNAKPVFADILNDGSGLIDPQDIRNKITGRSKVIIPVDYAGQPADMEEIRKIADEHKLTVIRDSCHSLGSIYKGTKTGSCAYSDMTVFSFHPVKHMTTGEGGMVTTNSRKLYDRLLMLRNHGIRRNIEGREPWYYEVQELGYNYRLTDLQCALGLSQMRKLPGFIERRKELAARYSQRLACRSQALHPDREHSYHLYVIMVEKRREVFERLMAAGIKCQVHYIPVHFHPLFRERFPGISLPKTEQFYKSIISIPLYPGMEEIAQDRVIEVLK